VRLVRHAIITYNGTWGAGLIQYPSDVVNGLAQYIDDTLCQEVPCPYPATFGPLGGSPTADSYEQSVAAGLAWTGDWLAANPTRTWGVIGYSQGAELAAMVQMALAPGGELDQYAATFIGGITFGNPRRMAGAVAPGVGNPGPAWRGISTIQMPSLPTIAGQIVWADYVHSKANGDAGDDMYAMVPTGQVGTVMSDVYATAVQAQLNNGTVFLQDMVHDLEQIVADSGILSGLSGGLPALLGMGVGAGITFLTDLLGISDPTAATGVDADVAAAVLGLQFLAAPGGATAPHISYLGEINGYSNLVADAVGFLRQIAVLTPARA
jgi:hypothetical protein